MELNIFEIQKKVAINTNFLSQNKKKICYLLTKVLPT